MGRRRRPLEYSPAKTGKEASEKLMIFADTSYAPPHEQFRSVQGILISHHGNTLVWQSVSASFHYSVNAEAELLGYSEAYMTGMSTYALLQVLELDLAGVWLQGDNKAALSLCTADTGSWRTRHLRVRAAKLREVLADPSQGWMATHCLEGIWWQMDSRKVFLGQAFVKFRGQVGFHQQSLGGAQVERKSRALVEV